ncbi:MULTISPECIES: hypothetical protein [Methylotenera]|uniref:hypothetical protein n=1 Tax=Methylotenera TaxID=359407 RepID=UPI00037C4386|nr:MULTISPECIES: hypothetical protein [Methylotenera]
MNRDREGSNWSELKGRAKRQFVTLGNDLFSPLFSNDAEVLKEPFNGVDVIKKDSVKALKNDLAKKHLKDLSKMFESKSSYNVINIVPLLKKLP